MAAIFPAVLLAFVLLGTAFQKAQAAPPECLDQGECEGSDCTACNCIVFFGSDT
jgi:hypothetical protein